MTRSVIFSWNTSRMRADRLLRLLMTLQRHRRATASRLAAELEVSRRTVLRDMEALAAAGVPVYTERGRGGGCVLMDGYTTTASGITPAEAQALFAWAGRESASQLGLGTPLSSALAKIAATAPEASVRQAEELGQVVLADRRRWFAADDEVPLLPVLRDAALRRRRLRVRYRSSTAAAPGTRTLDPIGLVDHSGRWYLVAEHRHEVRTYRVSRIVDAVALDVESRRSDDRPVGEIWQELRTRFERGQAPIEAVVTVRTEDPETVGTLRRLLAMQFTAGRDLIVEASDRDLERWRITVRQAPVLAATAVLHAPTLTIEEPGWLRAQVRQAAERALAHYRPA